MRGSVAKKLRKQAKIETNGFDKTPAYKAKYNKLKKEHYDRTNK